MSAGETLRWPAYKSTLLRAPLREPVPLPHDDLEWAVFGDRPVGELEHDLTRAHDGEPLGERIIVHGRVTDAGGRPVPQTLVEMWQANSAGRYAHAADQHPAPLDPNFTGIGRCMTNARGEYRFVTIRPGAYPWRNHENAWRPAHLHFSLFGRVFTQRLITQMYFPNDPLFEQDPILMWVRDAAARARLVAEFDLSATEPEWALGYRFDIVLGATPMEDS